MNVEAIYSKAHQISKFLEVRSLAESEVTLGSRGEIVRAIVFSFLEV